MNKTIKKRIEEINNGIVPEGYEKTSFGIFPCDWEKDKSLGDICEINPKTEALPNEFIYIDLESVVDGKLIQENVIENAKAPSRAQRVLQKNDIIYQMVRPYQKNNFIFIQDDGSFKYVASTGYAQLRSDNYSFLYQMVNSEYFCTQVLKKCTGTNYPAINSQDLAEVNCAYPKDEQEQSRIAEILMQWDKAIELQEKLIEAYQKSKKYYLNKMFPKKGSNVPEIRFPGFTAPWEQRKVSNMFKVTRGYVLAATLTSADQSTETPYPVFSSQTKDNGLMGYYKDYLYENAITWTTDGANAGTVNFRSGKFYCTNVCGVLLSNDVKASPFIAEALNNVAKSYVSYVGNPKLMNNVMAEIEICIPIEKDEQDKLSQVFTILDNLITLHQQKRDKLLKQRQAMQQYLLTGIVRV